MQRLALADNEESDQTLTEKVLEAQHVSVRLPIIRKVKEAGAVRDAKGKVLFKVEKDQTIICDIV